MAATRRRPAHDVRCFGINALLFAEGAPAQSLQVIVEGSVMLFKLLPDGRRHILENANKGKREVIKIKVIPGEKVPAINRVWD